MQTSTNRSPMISVCMAVHNGERYVREQLESILEQLRPTDEVVVVDDLSRDSSVPTIEMIGDDRIRLLRNSKNLGVIKTFERAISEARGDLIFLSDQDDQWSKLKVQRFLEAFQNESVTLVLSNGETMSSNPELDGKTLYVPGSPPSLSMLSTLFRNRFQGSAMAFRRGIAEAALPFPSNIPMHDSWIGAVNCIIGRSQYIDENLLSYRRHDANVTTGSRGSTMKMAVQRSALFANLLSRIPKLLKSKEVRRLSGSKRELQRGTRDNFS